MHCFLLHLRIRHFIRACILCILEWWLQKIVVNVVIFMLSFTHEYRESARTTLAFVHNIEHPNFHFSLNHVLQQLTIHLMALLDAYNRYIV